jgi:ElaB/YqjD/DUF883 family membrane-anchored ribosome-binding protein
MVFEVTICDLKAHAVSQRYSEWRNLRSQFSTSSWGGRRFSPYAFTEHGALMAANVLNSPRAIEVSIFLVRAFIAMREAFDANKDLAARIDELERKYDAQFKVVFDAIRELMSPQALRGDLERKLGEARKRLADLQDSALEQGRAAVKYTDEYVHENPWQSIAIGAGVAALVGIAIGALLADRR